MINAYKFILIISIVFITELYSQDTSCVITDVFYTPNAETLKKGDKRLMFLEFSFVNAAYGITDNVNIDCSLFLGQYFLKMGSFFPLSIKIKYLDGQLFQSSVYGGVLLGKHNFYIGNSLTLKVLNNDFNINIGMYKDKSLITKGFYSLSYSRFIYKNINFNTEFIDIEYEKNKVDVLSVGLKYFDPNDFIWEVFGSGLFGSKFNNFYVLPGIKVIYVL